MADAEGSSDDDDVFEEAEEAEEGQQMDQGDEEPEELPEVSPNCCVLSTCASTRAREVVASARLQVWVARLWAVEVGAGGGVWGGRV